MDIFDPELALAQVKAYEERMDKAMTDAGLKLHGKVKYKGAEYSIVSAHLPENGELRVELGDGKQSQHIVPVSALDKKKGG